MSSACVFAQSELIAAQIMNEETDSSIEIKLTALLALTALQHRDDDSKPRKVEEVLATCGVKANEIAAILGKKEPAVRKTLQRAGIKTPRGKKS
jgi:hypothetical protein